MPGSCASIDPTEAGDRDDMDQLPKVTLPERVDF